MCNIRIVANIRIVKKLEECWQSLADENGTVGSAVEDEMREQTCVRACVHEGDCKWTILGVK